MQKEINKQRLYTSIFEYEGFLFTHQYHIQANNVESSLARSRWSKLANRHIFTSQEDRKELKEELKNEITQLTPIIDSKNAWWSFFRLSKDLGSLVLVKTDQQEIGGKVYEKQKIWKQYAFFKDQYERLKDVGIKTKEIAKERKKCERLMHYWEQKKLAASSHQGNEQGLYTIVLEYNGDVFVYQFSLLRGEPIGKLLKMWSSALKDNDSFIDERNYSIINKRVIDNAYELAPSSSLTNVWSTYFTLSKGLGNIYVIKTDEEITPGG